MILVVAEDGHHDGLAGRPISSGCPARNNGSTPKLDAARAQLDRSTLISSTFVLDNHGRELFTLVDQVCALVRVQQTRIREPH
ncbi:MAG TPA: hypothetical protein VF065_15070, partial [Ilumatobacter sp.]